MKEIITIDEAACTGCGRCALVCPKDVLAVDAGVAKVVPQRDCMECGHCEAACPEAAVHISALDGGVADFTSFVSDDTWMGFGEADAGELVRLMRSRRSTRTFRSEAVERTLLEDLVRIGVTAPSGTNSQAWTFTLLPSREAVTALGDAVGDYFRRLNAMARKRWLRTLLSLVGKPELTRYWQGYYQSVQEALERYERDGDDLLFHGAPAAILVGAKQGASCPAEDALLATQNILLGAHAMGLGTCLIGYVVEAARRDESVLRRVQIPEGETLHAVIALGWPKEQYARVAGRKKPLVRVIGE